MKTAIKDLTNTELHAIARAVAPLLGDGWSFLPNNDAEGKPQHWALITHRDGYGLHLSKSGGWSKKPTRLNINGDYPRYTDEHGTRYQVNPRDLWNPNESAPEISVNPEKTPDAIAKDIARRLLPEYIRIWGRCKARQEGNLSYAGKKRAAQAAIAAIPGVHFHGRNSGEVNYEGWVKFGENVRRDASIRINSADSIEVKVDTLTVDQTTRLIEFLRTL